MTHLAEMIHLIQLTHESIDLPELMTQTDRPDSGTPPSSDYPSESDDAPHSEGLK